MQLYHPSTQIRVDPLFFFVSPLELSHSFCVILEAIFTKCINTQLATAVTAHYGKRQGTLKSDSEWRGEWRMCRLTANGERRGEH